MFNAVSIFICFLVLFLFFAYKPAFSGVVIQTIAYEASNQSLEGQVAVAEVILNRAYYWKKTPEQVCMQPYQFSCWNAITGKPMQNRLLKDGELKMAEKALTLAKHKRRDKTLYYMREGCVPTWLYYAIKKGTIVKSHQIGDHIFYKEVK